MGIKRRNVSVVCKFFHSFTRCFYVPVNIIIIIIIATNYFMCVCYRSVSRQILIFIPSYKYLYILQLIIKDLMVLSTMLKSSSFPLRSETSRMPFNSIQIMNECEWNLITILLYHQNFVLYIIAYLNPMCSP